jgi:beta-lactamase class D
MGGEYLNRQGPSPAKPLITGRRPGVYASLIDLPEALMSNGSLLRLAATVGAAVLLGGCSLLPGQKGIDKDKLEAAIDANMGGANTCVVLLDAKTGLSVFQYGSPMVCRTPLPPCTTFDVPLALVGLDQGLITPQTVYKWDQTPQPVKAWETDADITKAFHDDIGWWWADLATAIGHDKLSDAARRLDYGNKFVDGPAASFWMGPPNGGGLVITTDEQAHFFKRFYAGELGLKPATSQVVQQLLVREVRDDSRTGRATFSAAQGTCPSNADGSNTVGWAAGRLQTKDRDLIYAASVNAAAAATPPGMEIRDKLRDIFASAGLWPAGS